MMHEHPRVNQWMFQSFDFSAWGYDCQRVLGLFMTAVRMASNPYRAYIYVVFHIELVVGLGS